jgi:hypothetical protein
MNEKEVQNEDSFVTIKVKTMDASLVDLRVEKNMTILELKNKISEVRLD